MSSTQLLKPLERSSNKFVGAPLKRREDSVLLSGHGVYVDDVKFSGMLYAAILRSDYAHARIKNIDLSRALESPGVVLALSGREISRDTKPLPLSVTLPWMKKADVYMLAVDKVHFTGEAVAVVLATDRYLAEDALEKIEIEYEPLQAINNAEKSLEADAPRLYESWDSNELIQYNFKIGDVEDALANSDYVIKERIERHRYAAAPLETRGYVASYDLFSKVLTYYASTQTPHILRTLISESLELSEDRIRVVAPNVGGGFGQKIPLYQEEPLVAYLSMKTGRPVKWLETRSENLKAGGHS